MATEHLVEIWVTLPDNEELEQLLDRLADAICTHHDDDDCPWGWVMSAKPAYNYVLHERNKTGGHSVVTPNGK